MDARNTIESQRETYWPSNGEDAFISHQKNKQMFVDDKEEKSQQRLRKQNEWFQQKKTKQTNKKKTNNII